MSFSPKTVFSYEWIFEWLFLQLVMKMIRIDLELP
jgi:hypothetical protein